MKRLSILISFLVPLANQLAAEEISLICKTKKEYNGVFHHNDDGKVTKFEEFDNTRHESNITFVIGNGTIDDKDFLWPRSFECIGYIWEKVSDSEISVGCEGVESPQYGQYPKGSKQITVSRLTGDVVGVLRLNTDLQSFSSFYEGNCTKAEQKF